MVNLSSQERPTTAEISLDNLRHNFCALRLFVGEDSTLLSVVKADSYGHGAIRCAVTLQRAGCEWFGVALVEEAIALRDAGIEANILCLGGFWPAQAPLVIENRIVPALFDLDAAASLDEAARSRGVVADVHVKIDSGMGRVGVPMDAVPSFAERLSRLPNLRVDGLMTHFSSADDRSADDFTRLQMERFDAATEIFRANGFSPRILDLANSPGAIVHPESRRNLVRIGGLLYGLGDDVIPADAVKPDLRPVMSITSRIAMLKIVEAGTPLGYGRTFVTSRSSRIASVPIGYHDGVPRALSNQGVFLVNGKPAPIVGRVSMDWTLIDVSDIPEASKGSEVVIIGRRNESTITAADVARLCGTISYEITCGISARVPRRYVEAGQIEIV